MRMMGKDERMEVDGVESTVPGFYFFFLLR